MPQIANAETGAVARAKINAVLPQAVAFATNVPLDGRKVMAAQNVAGALAFAPGASPALGADCYVRLTADGTNAPSFAGFAEHGSSAGYFNAAGVVNTVRFWFDGATSWFAVAQALNVVPFVMQAAAIANAAPTQIQVSFAVPLAAGSVPAAAAFTIANSGGADMVSAVAIAGGIVTLTKSRTTLATDATIALTYIPPGSNALVDPNGNAVAGSTIAVTNNVAGAASDVFVQMTSLTRFTQGAHAGGGYDYTPTSTDYGNAGCGGSTVKLPAGAAGYLGAKTVSASGNGPMIGATTSATLGGINGIGYALYAADFGSGVAWTVWLAGNSPTPNGTALAYQAGDIVRVERDGASNILLRVARAATPTAFTTVHTVAGGASGALYGAIGGGTPGAGNVIVTPFGSSNVA